MPIWGLTVLAAAVAIISLVMVLRKARELQRATDQLSALYRTSQLLASALEPEEVATRVVEVAREIMGYGRAAVMRVSDATLRPVPRLGDETSEDGMTSKVTLPVVVDGTTVAVLTVAAGGGRRLGPGDARLIGTLAGQLSAIYRNALRHEQLRDQAMRDSLTGLLDHAAFERQLNAAVARAKQDGSPVAVVLADLDDFRLFNDAYGHVEGDNALRLCAETIRTAIRDQDLAARYGGEEFAIILSGATRDGARGAAERIRRRLERPGPQIGPAQVALTASFGVAAFPDDATTALDLMRRADEALAVAKYSGKNCVRTPVVVMPDSRDPAAEQ